MATDDTGTHSVTLRIPLPVLARVDALAEQVRAADPYASVNRTDALLRAIRMGLDAAEVPEQAEARPSKRKRNAKA